MPVSDLSHDQNFNSVSLLQAIEQLLAAYEVLDKKIEILHQYSNKDFLRVNPYLGVLQNSLKNIEANIKFQENLCSKSHISSLDNGHSYLEKTNNELSFSSIQRLLTDEIESFVKNTISHIPVIKSSFFNKENALLASLQHTEVSLAETLEAIQTIASFFKLVTSDNAKPWHKLLEKAQLNVNLSIRYQQRCTELKGQVINSLQYHDITSQRLEHIRTLYNDINQYLSATLHRVPAHSPYTSILPEITLLHTEQLKTLSTEYLIAFQKIENALTQTNLYLNAIDELYNDFPLEVFLQVVLTELSAQSSWQGVFAEDAIPAWKQIAQSCQEALLLMEALANIGTESLNNNKHPKLKNSEQAVQHLSQLAQQNLANLRNLAAPLLSVMQDLHFKQLQIKDALSGIQELKSQLYQVKDFELMTREIVTELQLSLPFAQQASAAESPEEKIKALQGLEASYTMYSERAALEHILEELNGKESHQLSSNEINSLDYKGSIELF